MIVTLPIIRSFGTRSTPFLRDIYFYRLVPVGYVPWSPSRSDRDRRRVARTRARARERDLERETERSEDTPIVLSVEYPRASAGLRAHLRCGPLAAVRCDYSYDRYEPHVGYSHREGEGSVEPPLRRLRRCEDVEGAVGVGLQQP